MSHKAQILEHWRAELDQNRLKHAALVRDETERREREDRNIAVVDEWTKTLEWAIKTIENADDDT